MRRTCFCRSSQVLRGPLWVDLWWEAKPKEEIGFPRREGGSTMSHGRLGYLDFRGEVNVLNWEADEVLPFNLSSGSPLCCRKTEAWK